MDREELVRAMVMRAIADDYEDFEMVVKEVTDWTSERGIRTSRDEIAAGLTRSIETGFAKAYVMGPGAREAKPSEWRIALSHPDDTDIPYYFLLTDEGKRVTERLLKTIL